MAGKQEVGEPSSRSASSHPARTALALGSLTAAFALACLLGCASEARGARPVLLGSEERIFLILPLNVAAAMPEELESFSPIVWKELELYLRAQGKQLKTISRQAARKLWVRSIRQARAGEKGVRAGHDDAARALALELRNHTEFDAMIAPALFVRKARISDGLASWDGVERELEFEANGLEAWHLAATWVEGSSPRLEGVAPAASLHVAVFDAKGEKLHQAQGGLELLVRVRVAGSDASGRPKFQFATRTGLFENREHVRDGISAAFVSFLPPLPEWHQTQLK